MKFISKSFVGGRVGLISACALAVFGCGGGGGGGGASGPPPIVPVAYVGNTSQAVITAGNAAKLALDVLGAGAGTDAALGGLPLSADAAPPHTGGLANVARLLDRGFLDALVHRSPSHAARPLAASPLSSATVPCFGGGSVGVSGTLSSSGTGTLSISFNGCSSNGDTLSGPATMLVAAVDPNLQIPTDFTLSFDRLALRGASGNIDLGGSLRSQAPLASNTETITMNVVSLDNNTHETKKAENLTFVDVSVRTATTTFNESVTGRVFDAVHGYVDIATVEPLGFFSSAQPFPNPGQLTLAGSSGRSIRVTTISDQKVMLELDLDGDANYEGFTTLLWTQLSGTTVLDAVRPTSPVVSASVNSDRSVTLTWTPSSDSSGIREYRIRRGTMPIGRTTGTSFTDRSVEPGSTVDYIVRAVDDTGNVSELLPPKSVKIPSSGTAAFGMPISGTLPFENFNGIGLGVADVNGDGNRDLVVSGGVTALGPLTAGLSFAASPNASLGLANDSNLPFFYLTDITGSNLPEALGGDNILAWNPTTSAWEGIPGSSPSTLFHARTYIDLNDDGILDMVGDGLSEGLVPTLFGTLGSGNGGYEAGSERSLAGIKNFAWGRIGAIVAADLDRDGLTDLIVWDTDKLRVVRQTQRGVFAVTASLPAIDNGGFRAVILVADVTGDGSPEIIFADYQNTPNQLRVYVNDGSGNFGTPAIASNVLDPWNFSAADINGDGVPDLVAGNRLTQALDLYISQGNGTFTLLSSIGGVGFPNIQLADVDLDGDIDIVIAGGAFRSTDIKLYLNQ